MRRHLSVYFVLGVVFTLATIPASAQEVKKEIQGAATPNYYPIDVGNTWNYRVTINGTPQEVTTRISKLETFNGEALARLDSLNPLMNEHLRQNDKGVFRVRSSGMDINPPVRLLPYPAKTGTKWHGEFKVGKEPAVHKYFGEIQKEESIEVPAGKFKALRVQIKIEEKGKSVQTIIWFARNVGLVKQTFAVPGNTVVRELIRFEQKK